MSDVVIKNRLQRHALVQNMDFEDYLHYLIKDLEQQYDFWQEKQYKHFRGAKIRARNLLSHIRDAKAILQEINS